MKVTFDRYRILHLILLMACSWVLAKILIAKLEWTAMSAYGFACTLTTQINQAINSAKKDDDGDNNGAEKKRQDKRDRVLEKRKERRNGQSGIPSKKKK